MDKKWIAVLLSILFIQAGLFALPMPAAEEPALIITGDGVERETSFTLAELKAMTAFTTQNVYSAWNTWPTKQNYYARGVSLTELLKRAGLKDYAVTINVATKPEADGRAGYNQTFLLSDLLAERYTFEGGQSAVPAIIAFSLGEKSFSDMEDSDLRLIYGQLDAQEQTSLGFVKSAKIITVSGAPARKLPKPEAAVEPAAGGKYSVTLKGGSASVKIYYTTDGSSPTVHSSMYNISAPNWQPDLNKPFIVSENTVVRAITVAAGFADSDELSFSIAQGQTIAQGQPGAQQPLPGPEVQQGPETQPPAAGAEGGGIKVIVDGEALVFDVPPQNVNGRVLVPLRAIFEALGAEIDYQADTGTVTASKGDTVVALTIGDSSPTINGQAVALDQPGIIVEGRTLAPLRFVAEAFGGSVDWDGASQTAYISR